jgi:hypothetical protein
MFHSQDIARIARVAAPLALVCTTAFAQEVQRRVAPVPIATTQDPATQDPASKRGVAPWLEQGQLVGRAVVTKNGADDAARPVKVGTVADLIVDSRNFTTPFLVVDVVGGPRTTIAWRDATLAAGAKSFTVTATLEELRGRAEIDPDHLDRLLDSGHADAGAGVAEAGAKKAGDAAEATAKTESLPRLVLASRIAGHPAQARDGSAFGKIDRTILDPGQGDLPVLVVAVGDALHVVPAGVASLVRDAEKNVVIQFDRDAETLNATPRLDREDVSLDDPMFRAGVFRSVGLTPRGKTAPAAIDRDGR